MPRSLRGKGIKMKNHLLLSGVLLSISLAASADPLSAWNETPAKKALMKWVEETTTPGSDDYIPLNKRYVVFDNDGTLWPQSPVPVQIQFIMDEIKRLAPHHPEWKHSRLLSAAMNNDYRAVEKHGLDGLNTMLSKTHNGISVDEYTNRVQTWLKTAKNSRYGCYYNELNYLPMRQVLDYLREKGFKTWIVSSEGMDFMRVVSEDMFGIPPEQVIGSFSISELTMTNDGEKIIKTMKGPFKDTAINKPVAIHLFMGQRPVAAFGNDDTDQPMLRYSSRNPHYKTFAMTIEDEMASKNASHQGQAVSKAATRKESEKLSREWVNVNIQRDWSKVFENSACRLPDSDK